MPGMLPAPAIQASSIKSFAWGNGILVITMATGAVHEVDLPSAAAYHRDYDR